MEKMITKVLKLELFEYVVYKLDQWYRETNNGKPLQITKLRLQKVLFLLCAVNANKEKKGLLTIFTNFAALPLGPVEMDVYDAMNSNKFVHIHFNENECVLEKMNDDTFSSIEKSYKELVDKAIIALRSKNRNYLVMPIYELVELTHLWSAWKTAQMMGEIIGRERVKISANEICDSIIKAY